MRNIMKWAVGLLLALIWVSDMSGASDGLQRIKGSGSIAAEIYGLEVATACVAGSGGGGMLSKSNQEDAYGDSRAENAIVDYTREKRTAWEVVSFLGVRQAGIVFVVLSGILAIAFIISFCMMKANSVARRREDSDKAFMRRASRNLMARIAIYLIAYMTLILLSLMSVVALFYVTFFFVVALCQGWLFMFLAFHIPGVTFLVGLCILLAGVWAMAVMTLKVVVSPFIQLFKSKTDSEEYGVEVDASSAPELMGLIGDAARQVGVDMPLHVYIRPDVNAAAFYDKPLRSIYKPSSLNLALGAPLFLMLSQQELKAVIGHELGHFAQSELRQGVTAWYACSFINRILDERHIDNPLIERWCVHDNANWRYWGIATYNMIQRIRKGIYGLFRFVARADNEMKRCMELDADKWSARVAGCRFAVSAHYKIKHLGVVNHEFESLVSQMYSKGEKIPSDIYDCFRKLLGPMQHRMGTETDYSELKTWEQVSVMRSRVEIRSVWETHPDSGLRVAAMKSVDNDDEIKATPESSESLLSRSIWDMVSKDFLRNLNPEQIGGSSDKFVESATEEYMKYSLPQNLIPFFSRKLYIGISDLDVCPERMSADEIEATRHVCEEFMVAEEDNTLLQNFSDGRLDVSSLTYNGRSYNKKNVPLEDHRLYMRGLEKRIRDIDRRMMAHALTFDPAGNVIRNAYGDIFYAQNMVDRLYKEFEGVARWIVEFYNTAAIVDSDQVVALIADIEKREREFKDICRCKVEIDRLKTVVDEKTSRDFHAYMDRPVCFTSLNDSGYALAFVDAYRYMIGLHVDLRQYSVKRITSVMTE